MQIGAYIREINTADTIPAQNYPSILREQCGTYIEAGAPISCTPPSKDRKPNFHSLGPASVLGKDIRR